MKGQHGAATPPESRAPGSAKGASLAILVLLAAGFALTMLVFYPGYVTADARYVYAEAMAWKFGDWQSPVMGVLWRFINPIAPGSVSMFLLTATLYWIGFGLLALFVARYSFWLGFFTPLLALAPPAFFFVGMIWRDILFGAVWLLAAALSLFAAERNRATRVPVQAVALLLIALGILLRPNAIIAAPILAIYAVMPRSFGFKRASIVFLPGLILSYALVQFVYYGLLEAKRQHSLHSILVFDLGGITHFATANQFPVEWSPEQAELLTSRCYDPVRWDSYWHVPPCPFVMQRLEQPGDLVFGSDRLVEAWKRAVRAHPLAYLAHRGTFMWQFLARSNLVLPVWDWQEPGTGFGNNPRFRRLVALHDILQPGLLFRPGLWLIFAGAVCLFAWRTRSTTAGAFAAAVTSCAIVYMASFFFVGVASDFRYAYWCVLATLAGAVAAVLARRVKKFAPIPNPRTR